MTAPPIPQHWTDLDADWLNALLSAQHPELVVDDVTLLDGSDGTNRRARFAVSYSQGDGPRHIFVKAEGAHREAHARNGNLFNEPRLFSNRARLPLEHARAFGVLVDEPAQDWLVVFEDVTDRGADPRDSTRPVSAAQAADGLRGLARLHAEYWEDPASKHPELGWLETWTVTDGWLQGLGRCIPVGLDRLGRNVPPAVYAMGPDGVVDAWARYVSLLDRGPTTLLHADAHIGNTYVLDDHHMGFLDWQVARAGHWSQDVGYFLQGAVTAPDRRAHERDLLDAYVAELGRDVDDPWTWYRASAVYGLGIWLSTAGTDGYQPPAVSAALAERYATAVVELDSLAALDELGPGCCLGASH